MRTEFEFYCPIRIVTGVGESQKLDKWVKSFHANLVLVIADAIVAKTDAFLDMINSMKEQGIAFEVFSDTIPEPPMELIDDLAARVREQAYDLVIAVGGGSPMDTAKAVCMLKHNEGRMKDYLFGGSKTPIHPSIPLICIPTTAGSGSEVSCASVIEDTEEHIKLSCTHPNLYAKVAILDPLMQKGMPAMVTAGTGMDAMTHAIESYTSKNSSVYTEMYARKAIEMIAKHLPVAVKEPENLDSRMMMAQASTLAAISMANGGLGAVHGISQSMGGVAHTPHGITNAILLPKVMKYNYKGDMDKFADIAGLLGVDTHAMTTEEAARAAGEYITRLNTELNIPDNITSLKVTRDMFPDIVKGTMGYRLLWMNPIEFTEELGYRILGESL